MKQTDRYDVDIQAQEDLHFMERQRGHALEQLTVSASDLFSPEGTYFQFLVMRVTPDVASILPYLEITLQVLRYD